MSIEERVSRVLVNGIGLEPGEIMPSAELKQDLGVDSTEMVEVLVALEKEFGVKIPDGVISGGSRIRDVVDYLSRTLIQ
ncbi:MAG TPA: acyl carrier protein [Nitrospirota bacterium]|nr:acyl carrier protein [Nitrospirota bacterium]